MADDKDESTKDVKKKTRASKPKVKTGCMTCKSRRVKCDETKPYCSRCIRFGYQCDGYEQEQPKRNQKSPPVQYSPRVLVPKSNSGSAVSSPIFESTSSPNSAISPTPTPPQQILGTVFKSEDEYQSFQRFAAQTAVGDNEESWRTILYQAYTSSPLIQFTILSVGSMYHEAGTFRYQSLHHSSLAPRDLHLSHESQRTFTASLLLNCLESFYGYRLCAIEAISDGLHSIGELFLGQGKEELRRILNDQSRAYTDARNAEIQKSYSSHGQQSVESLPQKFSSLHEARVLLELITRRSLHSLACSLHFQGSPGSRERRTGLDADPPSAEQQRMLGEYESWNSAFSQLFSICTSPDGEVEKTERMLALTLRLLWLSGYLLASSNTLLLTLNSGRFDTELKELTSISVAMQIGSNSKMKELVFDTLDLLPLTLISWQMPAAAELRDLACGFLESSPRREETCDGTLILKVLRFLECETNFEEKDAEIRLRFDPSEKVALVSYPRVNNVGREKFMVEVAVPW